MDFFKIKLMFAFFFKLEIYNIEKKKKNIEKNIEKNITIKSISLK
jgi:hypothetical protein